jgi:hypothetical protein
MVTGAIPDYTFFSEIGSTGRQILTALLPERRSCVPQGIALRHDRAYVFA